MIPTVMRVFLSDQPTSAVEVPITPNTTAKDVIECCKAPGELHCHLAEVWRGKERPVSENEKLYTVLQQWGSNAGEVQFYLRHDDKASTKQTEWASGDNSNVGYIAKDGHILTPNGSDMTLSELKEIAAKQQQQIELRHKTLVSKEQRLRFLKQQLQQQQAMMSENEKLRMLQEKAEAQEAKLQKIRALHGKVHQQKYDNTTMSSELDAVKSLFEEKQIELSFATLKVQKLTKQLDELQKGKLNSNFTIGNTNQNGGKWSNELEKLKREMGILNQMNEDQQKKLDEQRSVLKRRNEDASELDRRIEELTNRLRQKKIASSHANSVIGSRMHTSVAAVQPVVKKTDRNVGYMRNLTPLKPEQSFSPSSTGHSIIGRIDQAPVNEPPRSQPEGFTSQADFYNRGLHHLNKADLSKSMSAGKAINTSSFSTNSQFVPNASSSSFVKQDQASPNVGPVNIFAYKSPSQQPSQFDFNNFKVTVLPSGNIKYKQVLNAYPPPPYPGATSIPDYYRNQSDHSFNPEITVDIEALRRKFARAPRPLKKRSSITEVERPQGPVISKLVYDQLYKKADTPFYRLPSEHRSTPPPAYIKPLKAEDEVSSKIEETIPVSSESQVAVDEKEPQQFLPDVDDNNDSNEHISDDTSIFPPPPMPLLSAIPSKGILKQRDAPAKDPKRRIRFDPLALLLDASLEGEIDLVKKIIDLVPNPSGANDEGITALHNAVCAGHFELVKFLVHYGSDINASDTDGWTPLHCAASCNNLTMCRFLVESGACIFANTFSDGEVAADKCEELDEGFIPCSDFLYSTQNKLGVVRQGQVYALYDYEAANDDELSFHEADLLTVIRKGDDNEEEWWWARLADKEGYIPRNLLGMWPRIKQSKED